MATPATVADFVSLLRKSGLLEPDVIATHEADLPDTPVAAARKLIKLGLITPYHAEHLLAGRTKGFFLGAYRLLGKLGKGGMGAVYLAEHTSLKRRVALKVFPPERASDPSALARFQREGRAAAALDHPNIVRVHDIAHAGTLHFLVMEYAEGVTLDQVIKDKGPLPPDKVIAYARQIAEALAHAHAKGIVHRDIKPANLLLDPNGVVKVLDIGLARITHDSNDDLTKKLDEHAVLGTADYIAPEQALDSAVDGRADLYSLGATLYALLAGTPPFGGTSISQKLVAHQMKEAKPLSEVRPSVPAELAAIVTRLMAKKPEDRFPSADALLAALDGRPEPAARPRRPLWPMAAAALVLTVSGAALGGWMAMANRAPRPEPRVDQPDPKPEVVKPEPAKPEPVKPEPVKPEIAPTPVVAAPTPALYRLDLNGQPPTGREARKGDWRPLDGPVSQRWRGSVWHADTKAAFGVEQFDGRPALFMRLLEGKSGAFFILHNLEVKAARRYVVDATHREEHGGSMLLRILHPGKKAVDLVRPARSPERWTAVTQMFEPESDGKLGLEFHLSGPGPEAALFLREVAVRDVGPITSPYTLRTFGWERPFRVKLKQREKLEEEGTIPSGVNIQAWGGDAIFEAQRVVDGGRGALKLVMRQGRPSGMVFLATPATRTDRTYTVKVEYRTRGNPRSVVKFKNTGTTAKDIGRLEVSSNWRVDTFRVEATREEPGTVEIHHQGARPDDELFIGKVQWILDGVAAK